VRRKAEFQKREPILWPFFLQMLPLAFLPFVVWWGSTPTNELFSSSYGMILESIGLKGLFVTLFGALPIGVIGLVMLRKMSRLRIATRILSIFNIICGGIELGMMVLLLYAVMNGASV